jgi:hypothetical protein
MMSKKPADRFQSAGEVAVELKAWLADRGRAIGGGTIEERDAGGTSGVGSGVFTRYALGVPPSSSKGTASGSSRTVSVSDRDTKKLDDKGSGGGTQEEIGLAPLDEEDVLGMANRRPAKKASGSDKQVASTSDLATSSDVGTSGLKLPSKSSSGKAKSLLEEELTDPEVEHIKRKVAERAQFNPLQPPNYVPPSSGSAWLLWAGIGTVAVIVIGILIVAMTWNS